MNRYLVGLLAVVAALAGLFLTAVNGWGAGAAGPCRDTFTGVVAACAAPRSPLRALAVGALLPACAVAAAGAARAPGSRSG